MGYCWNIMAHGHCRLPTIRICPLQSSLNLQSLLADKQIIVPDYQRAYAWETPSDSSRSSQVDVFLADLERHQLCHSCSPYYLGHFLFERTDDKLHIIDGQQRLTTITLFLQALFTQLRSLRVFALYYRSARLGLEPRRTLCYRLQNGSAARSRPALGLANRHKSPAIFHKRIEAMRPLGNRSCF